MSSPFEIGSLVTYKSRSGKVQCKVVDVIPDIDRTYYALKVTSTHHPRYYRHTEILVPVGSPSLVYKRPSKFRTGHTKTHCDNEHEFTPDNSFYEVGEGRTGVRHCRVCHRANNNRYYAKKVGKDG